MANSAADRVFHSAALTNAGVADEAGVARASGDPSPEQGTGTGMDADAAPEIIVGSGPDDASMASEMEAPSTGSALDGDSAGSGLEDEAQDIVGAHIEYAGGHDGHGIDDVSPGALQRQLSQASILREAGRVARFQTMLSLPNLDMGASR
jgi:hypothetical protein